MTEKSDLIDLTPLGLKTPDGNRRVIAATRAVEDATVLVAMTALDFLNENRSTLLELARGAAASDGDLATLREALQQLDAVVSARTRKQEILLRAVAGAPPAPDEREDTI